MNKHWQKFADMMRGQLGNSMAEAEPYFLNLDRSEAYDAFAAAQRGDVDDLGLSPRTFHRGLQLLSAAREGITFSRARALAGAYRKGREAQQIGAQCVAPYSDARTTSGRLTYSRAFISAWVQGWKDAAKCAEIAAEYEPRLKAKGII